MPNQDSYNTAGNACETLGLRTRNFHRSNARPLYSLLRTISILLVLLLPVTLLTTSVQAQHVKNHKVLNKRGYLLLKDSSLNEALHTISEIWEINIVIGRELKGTVNSNFKDAPLYEILDSVLLANGYGYRTVGDSLVIVPLEELGNSHPLFKSITIPVRHAKIEEIVLGIQSFSSPKGTITPIASANSIVVVDYPKQLDLIQKIVQDIERNASKVVVPTVIDNNELDIMNYHPEYIDAADLREAISTLISAEGRATTVDQENQLVVIDTKQNIPLIRRALDELDRPRPQVRITALIYDISLDDAEQLGVDWTHALMGDPDANGDPNQLFSLASTLAAPFSNGEPSGVMTFQTLNTNFNLTAIVNLLRNTDDSRLLADPNVVVIDREQASIQITTEIPYQQLTQTSGGGDIGTTAFREAGVSLSVMPKIAADGTIQLEVTPSFSSLTGFTEGLDPQPIINKRETNTTVRVVDGQVLVIGGLRQRVDIQNDNGIPYLKDLKYVGRIFRSRETEVRESELVVFIKTEILGTDTVPSCRQQDAYIDGMKKLDHVPQASDFPWPKMSPPAPGVRETQWGSDPRPMAPQVPQNYYNHPHNYEEVPPVQEYRVPRDLPSEPLNMTEPEPKVDLSQLRRLPPLNTIERRRPQAIATRPPPRRELPPMRKPVSVQPRPTVKQPTPPLQQPVSQQQYLPDTSKMIIDAEKKAKFFTSDNSPSTSNNPSWFQSILKR